MDKPKKNVSCCDKGKHKFIVSDWQIGGGRQKAIHLLCQNCLMPIDLQEIHNAKWFEAEDQKAP